MKLQSIIGIFPGAKYLALGVIGEYQARMHFRLMDRSSYVARKTKDEVEPETLETPLVEP